MQCSVSLCLILSLAESVSVSHGFVGRLDPEAGLLVLARLWNLAGNVLLLDVNGSNSGNCQSAPCLTLLYAITMSSSGDTIQLGVGTFTGPQNRNLDPGSLGKANLIIQGQGPSQTILDLEASGRGFTFTAAAGRATLQQLAPASELLRLPQPKRA